MGLRQKTSGIWGLLLAVSLLLGLAGTLAAQMSRPPTTRPPTTNPGTQTQKGPGVQIDVGNILQKILKPKDKPQQPRPQTLLIGEFTLTVEDYSNQGVSNVANNEIVGASGTAWLTFNCAQSLMINPELVLAHTFEVVDIVSDPTTQISQKEAIGIRRDVKIGDHVELKEDAVKARVPNTAKVRGPADIELKPKNGKGDVLVHFDNATIVPATGWPEVGRITVGSAAYPTDHPTPKIIKLSVDGFTALIDILTLTPKDATANINLQLPANVGSATSCTPATLPLGTTHIKPNCEFYVEKPGDAFGPWIIGDTGLIASGVGYTADFNSTQSVPPHSADWTGVTLNSGTASGSTTIPKQSNTGYLAADYAFTDAIVVKSGFRASLTAGPVDFTTIDPIDYKITAHSAQLGVGESKIMSGMLGTGEIRVPLIAVCKGLDPNKQVGASFTGLTVQPDMDLSGEIAFSTGTRISWGELTHTGDTTISWGMGVATGFLYLPAGPKPTFSPDNGSNFIDFAVNSTTAIADMESRGMSGILTGGKDIAIYSPDRPGGTANPITMNFVNGWLRIGHRGVDGELLPMDTNQGTVSTPIGNDPADKREGYVGNQPFDSSIRPGEKRTSDFKFCTSAVYDSRIDGFIKMAEPANIPELAFADMKASSTANLLGGNVSLPTGGVKLDYWKLDLVPTGDPAQAGVVSARTGRLIFTAAGISEPVHFAEPFRLTWGEMLADGNLGELFFDYNPYGQRFDGIKYSPHNIMLSKYVSGVTDGYLATNGSVHINYFGSAFANIHDARNDGAPAAPYKGRNVTVPKTDEPGWDPTDLHLHGVWDDSTAKRLAEMDFPDAKMGYNEKAQNGFLGTGTTGVTFLGSNPLDATIEIHQDATDVCMSSTTTHDLDLGLFAALGGISQVYGCIRIEGPTLERMSLGGYLEQSVSAGTGIVEPKAGYVVEVLTTTTPSSFTFYAYGDMMMSVAASAVDISGSVFLKHDFAKMSAEGNVNAKIDCNSVLAGLEGKGQITWYVDPSIQYLQGRVAIAVGTWIGGAGMEGGLFVGHNVPKAKVWVLQTANGAYGVSQAQLPDQLTGVYGYGKVGFGCGNWLFSGGVELYAGMGAFTAAPPGLKSVWEDTGIGLPYIVGAGGIGVHGEILGGIVSASGSANLVLSGPYPLQYEGTLTLEGCVMWVFCGSVSMTTGLNSDGFYLF